MQTTLESTIERRRMPYLLPLTVIGVVLLFVAAPWPFAHKAHLALHGLCAQTPSHTYLLGGRSLPFDARMTGIYGGFIVSLGFFILRGRHRAAAMPSIPVCAVLAAMVGVMAIDGFNSLLLDMQTRHAYAPQNIFRIVTGVATGVALAAVLTYLFGVSLWQRPNLRQRVVVGRDFLALVPLQLPFLLFVLSGAGWLYVPLSMFLLASALIVLASIALVTIVLLRQIDCSFRSASELQQLAAYAIVAAVVAMGALSIGRTLLERMLGVPPLT